MTFGDHVFIAPNCLFTTAEHALDAQQRNEGLEVALPITIGNNVWIGENAVILAENEGKIMRILMEKSPDVVSKEELFQALWGTVDYVDENILQVNVSRLRKKLTDSGLAYTLQNIRGKGYVLDVSGFV